MSFKQKLLAFFLLFSNLVYGQDLPDYAHEQAAYRMRRDSLFQFGIEVYPKISVSLPTTDVQNSAYFKGSKSLRPCYSAGIVLKYNIKPEILIASGLIWQTISGQSDIIPADPMRGFLYNYTVHNDFNHIEIPLNIQYQHHSGFFAGAGISLAAILSQKQVFKNADEAKTILFSTKTITNSNRINFTVNAELGYSFSASNFNRFNLSGYAQLFLRDNVLYDKSYGTEIFPSLKFVSAGIKLAYLF